jgi:hypothetical protein
MSTQQVAQTNGKVSSSVTNSTSTNQQASTKNTDNPTGQSGVEMPMGESSLERLLKEWSLEKTTESSILVKHISETCKAISNHKAEIKSLRLKNKSVSRILTREGYVSETISADEKRGNRVKIQELKAIVAKLEILLKKYRSELHAAVEKEAWAAKLEIIRTNTQNQSYISKGKTFLARKFSKALQGIANGEYSKHSITKDNLISLRDLALQNPITVVDFDKALEKVLDKMSDGELAAFYSHDLKKLLRDAIIEILKTWDPVKDISLPEIKFPNPEDSKNSTEDKNKVKPEVHVSAVANSASIESTNVKPEMETISIEAEEVEAI